MGDRLPHGERKAVAADGREDVAKDSNGHLWLWALLAGVIVVMGAALVRRWIERVSPSAAVFIPDTFQPAFSQGSAAPDFAFPDRTGRKRRLSDLVRGDTALWFTCGCARCREMHRFM